MEVKDNVTKEIFSNKIKAENTSSGHNVAFMTRYQQDPGSSSGSTGALVRRKTNYREHKSPL